MTPTGISGNNRTLSREEQLALWKERKLKEKQKRSTASSNPGLRPRSTSSSRQTPSPSSHTSTERSTDSLSGRSVNNLPSSISSSSSSCGRIKGPCSTRHPNQKRVAAPLPEAPEQEPLGIAKNFQNLIPTTCGAENETQPQRQESSAVRASACRRSHENDERRQRTRRRPLRHDERRRLHPSSTAEDSLAPPSVYDLDPTCARCAPTPHHDLAWDCPSLTLLEDLSPGLSTAPSTRVSGRRRTNAHQLLLPIPSLRDDPGSGQSSEQETPTTTASDQRNSLSDGDGSLTRPSVNESDPRCADMPLLGQSWDCAPFDFQGDPSPDIVPSTRLSSRRRTPMDQLLLPIPSLRDDPASGKSCQHETPTSIESSEQQKRLSGTQVGGANRIPTDCPEQVLAFVIDDGGDVHNNRVSDWTNEISPRLPNDLAPLPGGVSAGDESQLYGQMPSIENASSYTQERIVSSSTLPDTPQGEIRVGRRPVDHSTLHDVKNYISIRHDTTRIEDESPATLNGRTILPIILEVSDFDSSQQELANLRSQNNQLLIEKQALSDRLSEIRKAYDDRLTPFRDVFQEKRKYRSLNQLLQLENQKLQVQTAQLMQEEQHMVEAVKSLRAQIAVVSQAFENSLDLRVQLKKANRRVVELEQELRRMQASEQG